MSAGGQVEKPRFFVDLLQYQYEIGNVAVSAKSWQSDPLEQNPNVISLNPTRSYDMSATSDSAFFKVGFKEAISVPTGSRMFAAILGHDLASQQVKTRISTFAGSGWNHSSDGDIDTNYPNNTPLVNCGDANGGYGMYTPQYDGWTLCEISPSITERIRSVPLHLTSLDGG